MKLISLNIESHKHLDKIIPFLQKEQPAVICLQEVYQADLPVFERSLGMTSVFTQFASITTENKWNIPAKGPWGVAILSSLPLVKTKEAYYLQEERKDKLFDHPNDIARALLVAQVTKDGTPYTIATTHFTWAPNKDPIPLQEESLERLLVLLDDVGDFVLCGDFNAPRGEKIFDALAAKYTDNIPLSVETTVDPEIHRTKGSVKLVIDVLFSTPEYVVQDVRVVCGVSDHCSVIGNIERK